jgi:hypothetical protein
MKLNKKEKLLKEFKEMVDNPDFFAELGHEFKGGKPNNNCVIWTGSETWAFKDKKYGYECEYELADYYNKYDGYKRFRTWLKKHNLWFEWYDAGTILIYAER